MFCASCNMSAPPQPRRVEDVYRPAIEEIRRRRGAAEDPAERADALAPEEVGDVTDHRVALVSIGCAVLAPRPVDPKFPALRIYGIFDEREDAAEHADIIREADPECSLIVVRCGQWMIVPQSEEIRDDANKAIARRDELLRAHRDKRRIENDEFDRCIAENFERPTPTCGSDSHWDDDQEETESAVRELYKRPKRLRGGTEVRGQTCCVISVIPDPVAGECLFKILRCFESTIEANEWASGPGRSLYMEEDLVVTSTCEWTYPNSLRVKTDKTFYRLGEQQKIMDAAEENPRKVKRYKDWLKEQEAAEDATKACDAGSSTEAEEGDKK